MNIISKKIAYLIMLSLSAFLMIYCLVELIDSMITYKYHFEDYFDGATITISCESRKISLEIILKSLIFFIVYTLLTAGYLLYINRKNKKNIHSIIFFTSLLLLIYCSWNFAVYMIEYKETMAIYSAYNEIEASYQLMKSEVELIMLSLKVLMTYFIVTTLFFLCKLFGKS